ncbi:MULTISPECIES: A24 family peptidase [Paraburkholderia]|jgi:prepilin peptidase CpaA|uniref:Prepilin peptidase CpaA n=1 Tax=Paraburkholderia terricola TaxID=169427 RepID=A0A1M6MNL8_9BURK|nr:MULTISPECIES: prepilin peptidase [Paraburkholderia]SDO06552.1 prepilin peptidase CpaA [Paraburkholderia sediminicola]SHJ85047.1 prepilin peptidase CpaA [Paraburkholderia terricola]
MLRGREVRYRRLSNLLYRTFHGALIVSLLSAIIRVTVLCALLRLAVFDVRWRRLPTRATLLIAALFFIDALVIRLPIHDVLAHLLLALAVLVICAALFAAKMLGGGDAKLACAVFLWTGPSLALPALAIVSVLGLGVSLVSLATRHMAAEQRFPPLRALAMFSGTRGVPYGVALALGGGSVIALPLLAMR